MLQKRIINERENLKGLNLLPMKKKPLLNYLAPGRSPRGPNRLEARNLLPVKQSTVFLVQIVTKEIVLL